jgi:endonuclease/exonuclease/phosphatase family metal-dependent hydrolase
VHHFEGMDGTVSVDAIAEIINREQPDLVGLQEVDRCAPRTDGADFPAELERLTGMVALFGPNLSLGGPDAEYGNAILSRLPVEDFENHRLPRLGLDTEQRGLLSARVTLASGGSLTFATTHLEHTSAAERSHQIATIREALRSAGSPPLILCGDFNARPDSAEMQLFESWGMSDAWEQAGEGVGDTIPSVPKPQERIDYIMLAAGLRAQETRVGAVENPAASDHLPVVADLVWVPGRGVTGSAL